MLRVESHAWAASSTGAYLIGGYPLSLLDAKSLSSFTAKTYAFSESILAHTPRSLTCAMSVLWLKKLDTISLYRQDSLLGID